MSPVTSYLMPSPLHPSGIYDLQDVRFNDLFQDHDRNTPSAHHRKVNSKEILKEAAPLEADYEERFSARKWQP